MITKNSNKGMMLAVVGLVGALVLATPAAAQMGASGQSLSAQTGSNSMSLSMLQRTGPGGDLANVRQATTEHTRGGTTTCPQETCFECLFLDSYNPINTYSPSIPGSELVNVVQTTNALTLGQPYVITITGTLSYWGYAYYTAPVGNPEPHPMFPSPAVPSAHQGDVASDWEYLFATAVPVVGVDLSSGPIHEVYDGISLDDGATFHDLVPMGGQFYNSGHSYSYLVEGQGKQAKFSVSDFGPHNDNYGMYKICIYKLKPITRCGTDGGGED